MIASYLLLTLVLHTAQAHFYISHPEPRERTFITETKCENPTTNIPTGNRFEAGSWFVPRHARANHNGGFVMYSLTPLTANPAKEVLIDKNNVFHMECQTLNCASKDMNDGGKYLDNQDIYDNSCWGSGFYWPNKVGKFVLFYYSYGGFGSNGVDYQTLWPYSTCINIELTASSTYTSNSTTQCTFAGGDQTLIDRGTLKGQRTPAGKCAYKTFDSPSSFDAAKVYSDIALGRDYDALVKGVGFGVPSYVADGTCKQITNVPKFTQGPADSNQNMQPAAPVGGFVLEGVSSSVTQPTTSSVAQTTPTSSVTQTTSTSSVTQPISIPAVTSAPTKYSPIVNAAPRCRSK